MKTALGLSVATSAALLLDGAVAATSGKFNVLSMNVAGLPAILNGNEVPGDKATNSRLIGSKFAEYGYDAIHVQEDFNYHAYIYATDNHPYRTATSGGVPFGSGLNTLSKYDWVSFRRIKWDQCSNASGADCLTPKGFTFMRLALSGSSDNPSTAVYVDVYNLHTDAGTEADDLTARQANLNQVAAYIAAWSTGNAVLVFGDTNSRYSRAGDTAVRSLLSSGFADPWVQLQRGGVVPTLESLCDNPSRNNTCETVDKIFYRSSPLVTLAATAFRYESARFLQANGSILSDHNPVYAEFSWATTTTTASSSPLQLQQSAFFGGDYGTWFSDVPTLSSKTTTTKPKPATLTFRGASRLDSVSLTLTDGTTFTHGGTGGTASSLALAGGEYWVRVELCKGEKDGHTTRNFYIKAVTSSGRTLAAGTATASCATFAAPEGWHIVGFLGQAGDEVDQLAFVYAPK
ncbi:Endonuclease/exonuclease/phosphatase [Chaetomium strumarium]|uniref:Endonuclease/exonuclease/phosphatase n=1 Tax=Chaetomium strumarium TaxID=1170767 RepID=A0AAJ0GPZ4_9PEZI|nr:Endonuclease/exonuclease/phosphatase [Chaetomium strumarium]